MRAFPYLVVLLRDIPSLTLKDRKSESHKELTWYFHR
jgi:hypothetical protein